MLVGELLGPEAWEDDAEGDPGGLVEEALSSGRAVSRSEVGRAPARVAVPVRLERAVCGVLVVVAGRGAQLAERDVELVELLGLDASPVRHD